MIYLAMCKPRASTAEVRKAIASFEKRGRSGRHSQDGVILHHILNHCVNGGVPFDLTFRPGNGYVVTRAEA